ALKDLGPNDTVGLWTFPTNNGSQFEKAADLTTAARNTSDLVRGLVLLRGSSDEESFYATIRASVDAVRAGFAPDRINGVVVLTGGGFPLASQKASELIAYLQGQGQADRIPLFMVAYGTTPASNAVL